MVLVNNLIKIYNLFINKLCIRLLIFYNIKAKNKLNNQKLVEK